MSETTQPPTVRIGTWNTQWDKKWELPDHPRGVRITNALARPGCEILCVTEGSAGLLPSDGCIIDAGTNWGIPPRREDHRKVLLWSRTPWTDVDCAGSPDFPGGRFVKGVTETSIGPLTVIGVCIPWHDAHVRYGRKDRARWQDHRAWLETFERLRLKTPRTVVLGDFNQRIPRSWSGVPKDIHELLLRAFHVFNITTAGELFGSYGHAIDHIAHSSDLNRRGGLGIWPKRTDCNEHLSDHFGVWADFTLAATA